MKSTNYTTKPQQFNNILGIAFAILVLAIPFFMGKVDAHIEHSQSLCPFKMLTGFPCPGCGITKSLIFLYRGDLKTSLQNHLFGIPLVVFCLALIPLLAINAIKQKLHFKNLFYSTKLAYSLATILGIYHIIRLYQFIKTNNIDDILAQSIWK